MIISVPRETVPGERRVALVPDAVKRLSGSAGRVRVEAGAGVAARFSDQEYRAAGAEIVAEAQGLRREADVLVMVHRPSEADVGDLKDGAVVVGMLQPATQPALVQALARRRVTSFSLDALPRITRAQPMDVLSAMATIAGYKAVLLAAAALPKFFPMLVTAAGTIPPAKVLVLGAGVAGLQAIATARRLGAIVQAFDVRPAVKEQVESLGAQFLAADLTGLAAEGAGGYARELSAEQHRRELELIHQHLKQVDVVISTAAIPGKPAPVLITDAMVRDMRAGAVIVDLAAETGGNCELTQAGREVEAHGVTIIGAVNLAATIPTHASQMFSRNMLSFLQHLIKDGNLKLDFQDELTAGACITHAGEIRHEGARALVAAGGS
ncbi:MAG: Re/Si-specific NAD(P)(+) transhydrogenase subunit alpha [Gemmatimonadetes bacterium]|nr:Re/Si-specific NAD(P)(+) transhydrogenase subunit alpha [Gemmatimonadota bacterium]